MKTFLFIIIGIIIFDIFLALFMLWAPKADKPITEEEYKEFKEYIKTYEQRNCFGRRKRNQTSPHN
jgi:hypothetical protein